MYIQARLTALLMALFIGAAAHAQGNDTTVVYLGAGNNSDAEALGDGSTPFSFGVLHLSDNRPLVIGFDVGQEGQMLDSTFGDDAFRQALSINGIVGTNLISSDGFRADGSAIVGLRESFADCPDSFLGYQCYADREPDTDYELNAGVLVNVTFNSLSIGVRATDASTQAIVGFRF